jgi:hypothetical protein
MSTNAVSLRATINGEVLEFLSNEKLTCDETRKGVVELINQISTYKEEGKSLFPEVYITEKLDLIKPFLINNEFIKIGRGPREQKTILKALKKCAPIALSGWAIYILRLNAHFEYGLFRSGSSILSMPISSSIIDNGNKDYPIILIHQIADKIVEVKGVMGSSLIINFGIRSNSELSPIDEQQKFIEKIIERVDPKIKERVRIFYSRLFLFVMQNGHGNLCLVLDKGVKTIPNYLQDGIILENRINVSEKITRLISENSLDSNAKLNSVFNVICGMMMSDGITIFSNDGSIIGFNIFIKHPENDEELKKVEGGARSRTFYVMKSKLSKKMMSVYIQSQDGKTQTVNHEQ